MHLQFCREFMNRPKQKYVVNLNFIRDKCLCQLCSKVLLIRHSYELTDAEVLNILDYQMADVLTQVLKGNILFLLLHLCSVSISHSERSFTFSLDTIADCNWHFCFFVSQISDNATLYEAITSLPFLPLLSLSLHFYLKFMWNRITTFIL